MTRLWGALGTLPEGTDWLIAGLLLVAFAAIALPLGFGTGFFKLERVKAWDVVLPTAAIALVYPSLFEELLFRALLIPRPALANAADLWLWGTVSLVIFVAAHPLNALILMPERRDTFYSPIFLTLAALLGLVCTLSYVQSASIWPPVVLHWLMVVVWLLGLGGYGRLAAQETVQNQVK
ncbi:MAG: CPBP family intramembrane metalloprotease [Leptolyngbya sp. SIO4C1]|nr:CPBP family intramembrane metalloprotease [Leptolyngbya sp. SIO4C1]